MIILDVRGYGEDLTLNDCSKLYDELIDIMEPKPVKYGLKQKILVRPDQIWINKWQADNIFSGYRQQIWDTWRGIPLNVMEDYND